MLINRNLTNFYLKIFLFHYENLIQIFQTKFSTQGRILTCHESEIFRGGLLLLGRGYSNTKYTSIICLANIFSNYFDSSIGGSFSCVTTKKKSNVRSNNANHERAETFHEKNKDFQISKDKDDQPISELTL